MSTLQIATEPQHYTVVYMSQGNTTVMNRSTHYSAAWTLFIAAIFVLTGSIPLLEAAEKVPGKAYTETIAVLQLLYVSEIHAREHYLAFTDVALKEGHTNIAHLFKAIANSEKVHASNFRQILKKLGVQVSEVNFTSVKVSTTKKNLKYATEIELSEIDTEYPQYIQRIKPEMHNEALEYINYAWMAEQQHRELIKDIQSGTGIFYNVLLEHFRSNPSKYYVNQNCGTTLTELPKEVCPVCYHPLDTF